MKLDIDHTMSFLEKDIPIDLFPLDSPLLKLSLFIVVMSVIVGTTIYRWNVNREWYQLGLLGSHIARYDNWTKWIKPFGIFLINS